MTTCVMQLTSGLQTLQKSYAVQDQEEQYDATEDEHARPRRLLAPQAKVAGAGVLGAEQVVAIVAAATRQTTTGIAFRGRVVFRFLRPPPAGPCVLHERRRTDAVSAPIARTDARRATDAVGLAVPGLSVLGAEELAATVAAINRLRPADVAVHEG